MLEDREDFLCAQKGDQVAKEKLFQKHIGLVHHVVKRYIGRGCEKEDLFQLGAIGLVKAIEKFDVSYEVCFSTYAVPMIAGEVRRFLRDDGMVKVSRGIKENGWKVKAAAERLRQEKGRDVTIQELSDATGILPEDVVIAMNASREVESIYKTVYQSDGSEIYLLDQIGNESMNESCGTQTEDEKVLNKLLLESVLRKLGQEEQMLIKLRYFENQTQTQVAGRLGMSQVQVSRLEKKLLLRMRAEITAV